MRFALQNSCRIEATPGARGQCTGCGDDLTAKCGEKRSWHWAHKSQFHCDHWWESETEWHRGWKRKFPADWQEIGGRDESGELHIADIKTPNGLVVEFQHSPIERREQVSREGFYGRMIWVLDGTRSKKDQKTFFGHISSKQGKFADNRWTVRFNPLVPSITNRWLGSLMPVFLDFGEEYLWYIPVKQDAWAKSATKVPKSEFIYSLLDDREPLAALLGA